MTESDERPNCDGVRRFCDLSSQFSEAYRAYAHRASQVHLAEGEIQEPADEVAVFLLYHALELALKGWLMLREPGMTVNRLRREYGHHVDQLGEAVRAHYPSVEPYLPLMRELDREQYAYPDIDDEGVPIPMPIESFAEFVAQCWFDLMQVCMTEQAGH